MVVLTEYRRERERKIAGSGAFLRRHKGKGGWGVAVGKNRPFTEPACEHKYLVFHLGGRGNIYVSSGRRLMSAGKEKTWALSRDDVVITHNIPGYQEPIFVEVPRDASVDCMLLGTCNEKEYIVSLKIAFPTDVPRRSMQMHVTRSEATPTLVTPNRNRVPIKVVRHEVMGDTRHRFARRKEPTILYAEGAMVLDVNAPDAKRKLDAVNGCSALIEPEAAVTVKASGRGIMFEVVFY